MELLPNWIGRMTCCLQYRSAQRANTEWSSLAFLSTGGDSFIVYCLILVRSICVTRFVDRKNNSIVLDLRGLTDRKMLLYFSIKNMFRGPTFLVLVDFPVWGQSLHLLLGQLIVLFTHELGINNKKAHYTLQIYSTTLLQYMY